MADETQTVTAVKYHTLHGEEHVEGSTYEAAVDDVANLVAQGMVTTEPPEPPPAKPSHPVEPMTSDDFPKG